MKLDNFFTSHHDVSQPRQCWKNTEIIHSGWLKTQEVVRHPYERHHWSIYDYWIWKDLNLCARLQDDADIVGRLMISVKFGLSFGNTVSYFLILVIDQGCAPVPGALRDLLTPSDDGGRGLSSSPWSLPRTSSPARPPAEWMDGKVLWPELEKKKKAPVIVSAGAWPFWAPKNKNKNIRKINEKQTKCTIFEQLNSRVNSDDDHFT